MNTPPMGTPVPPGTPTEIRNHHEIKTWPGSFHEVWKGDKTHEVRHDDRLYQVGDVVLMREWMPDSERLTGRWVRGIITSISEGQVGRNARLPPGLVVWSFREHSRGGPT